MNTSAILNNIQAAGEDFEWCPTTDRMIAAVAVRIPRDAKSIMDIGAGDGRVLLALAHKCEHPPQLYAIEKSSVLVQAQPEEVTPVGTELAEQDLNCLPVDYIFCNPPYSQYEQWACNVIEAGYAKKAFLVVPRRWTDNPRIAASLKTRGATARTIHSDDFLDAERRARAIVDIVEFSYPMEGRYHTNKPTDPFDIWFDGNIGTFDPPPNVADDQAGTSLESINSMGSIAEMVAAYDTEYKRMQDNYRAVFALDYAILQELGVNKDAVRDGIKKKMAGLKTKYWKVLFSRLDSITRRLSTKTKKHFLDRINGQTSVAFTSKNAYAIVLWAIKHANRYYDQQLVDLFRELATRDGASNYKSNRRTWDENSWRYNRHRQRDGEQPSHFALDYRFVVPNYSAIYPGNDNFMQYEYPGNLHESAHNLVDDIRAVLFNLGYSTSEDARGPDRHWESGQWQDFRLADDRVLVQCKAHKNGNLHFRFMPEAIKALNVEAGRLLGWLRSPADVVAELGYTADEAASYYGSNLSLNPSSVKLLTGGEA